MSDPAHIRLLEDVAKHFFGKPKYSEDGTELRFGTHGSLSLDLKQGIWFDHENNEGGGATDLIMREAGCREAREAYEWAEQQGYWINDYPKTKGSGGSSYAYGTPDPWEKLGEIVATYNYTDEKRKLLFQVLRFEPKGEPKTFRQRRPNPNGKGGWIRNTEGVRRVPYNLPSVINAIKTRQLVYVCEGEKDCNNLSSRGLVASTNPGGAWSAQSGYVSKSSQLQAGKWALGDQGKVGWQRLGV